MNSISLVFKIKLLAERILPGSLWRMWALKTEDRKSAALRHDIIRHLEDNEATCGEDTAEILQFLKWNPLHVFPYRYTSKYRLSDIQVHMDEALDLPYVYYNQKKLYFKRGMSPMQVRYAYRSLLIEQDISSPHRYIAGMAETVGGKLAVDVGAAEGIFALQILDQFEKVYLFETDKDWIEPLQATFKPYTGKVIVVNKFVSDRDDVKHCSIDTYFKEYQCIDLLKIDVDGAERPLLSGASGFLGKSAIDLVLLCTYHGQKDESEFREALERIGYRTEHSSGYMLFYHDRDFGPPYLRRGLLRAKPSRN